MCGCLSRTPKLGTWPITQACALTGNRTSDPLVHRPELNPLRHTSQGFCHYFFKQCSYPLLTFFSFFLFVALTRWVFFCLIFQIVDQIFCGIQLAFISFYVFFISDIAFFLSNLLSIVSMSFFMVIQFPLSSLSILITVTLNSMSDNLLASFSFSSFSGDSSFLSFGGFFVSPFQLSLVCYCVSAASALTSHLCGVAFCGRSTIGQSSGHFLIS